MKKRTRVMAILLACMLTASTILPAVNVYAEEPDMQKTDEMTEKITEEEEVEKAIPEKNTEVPDKAENTESTEQDNLLNGKNELPNSETQVQEIQDTLALKREEEQSKNRTKSEESHDQNNLDNQTEELPEPYFRYREDIVSKKWKKDIFRV